MNNKKVLLTKKEIMVLEKEAMRKFITLLDRDNSKHEIVYVTEPVLKNK